MSFFKDIRDGFAAYLKVPSYITRFNLRVYFIISAIIGLVLGGSILFLGYSFSDEIGLWLGQWYKWDKGSEVVGKILNVFSGALLIGGGLLIFKYILLVAMSPILSMVSEKIEKELSGTTQSQSILEVGASILRGIKFSGRNLFRELFIVAILFLLSLFPLFTIITAPLIFIVQAFYAGCGNMDYTMERYFNVAESMAFAKKHRGLAVANGSVFLGLLLIPVLGLLIAPMFAAVSSTVETLKRLPQAGGTNL